MSDLIGSCIAEAKAIAKHVAEEYGEFPGDRLNWKPDPKTWSVGQIFDHLITTNNLYFVNLPPVVDGTHRANIWSRIPFAARITGRLVKRAVDPASVRKFKTFPVFEPTTSNIPESVVADFLKNQEELIAIFEGLDETDLKTKIAEPIHDAVQIHVDDAIEVLVLHERRHLGQIERLIASKEFPK